MPDQGPCSWRSDYGSTGAGVGRVRGIEFIYKVGGRRWIVNP